MVGSHLLKNAKLDALTITEHAYNFAHEYDREYADGGTDRDFLPADSLRRILTDKAMNQIPNCNADDAHDIAISAEKILETMGITVKVAATHLYHGTRKKFKVGTVLAPQPGGYVDDNGAVEQIIEQHRPEGALPRSQSVFMVADPNEIDAAGGYEDYVYEVQPIGNVEKNDLSWYSDVSVYGEFNPDDPQVIEAAENYWKGVPYKEKESSLWEYRVPQAKIVRLVSSSKTAKVATTKMDRSGWILTDGRFEPCYGGEEHWQTAIRLGIVEPPSAGEDEFYMENNHGAVTQEAVNRGNVRVSMGYSEEGIITLEVNNSNPDSVKNTINALRNSPQIYLVDIEILSPRKFIQDLDTDQVVDLLLNGTVPRRGKGFGKETSKTASAVTFKERKSDPFDHSPDAGIPKSQLTFEMFIDGSPAGAIEYSIRRGNTAQIINTYVMGDYQRKGYGKQMYIAFINKAKSKGLRVRSDNALSPGAEGLWASLERDGIAKVKGERFIASKTALSEELRQMNDPATSDDQQRDVQQGGDNFGGGWEGPSLLDKDYWHPFGDKGTEPENTKFGAKNQILYHVTRTSAASKIKQEGILPLQDSNWVQQGTGERYGEGEIFAFTDPTDAVRWAGKMDWELNKSMGTGQISIVKFKDNSKWDVDDADPMGQAFAAGQWLKKHGVVPPEAIISITPVEKDLLRQVTQGKPVKIACDEEVEEAYEKSITCSECGKEIHKIPDGTDAEILECGCGLTKYRKTATRTTQYTGEELIAELVKIFGTQNKLDNGVTLIMPNGALLAAPNHERNSKTHADYTEPFQMRLMKLLELTQAIPMRRNGSLLYVTLVSDTKPTEAQLEVIGRSVGNPRTQFVDVEAQIKGQTNGKDVFISNEWPRAADVVDAIRKNYGIGPITSSTKIPPALNGLAAEARKAPTFKDFYRDFIIEIKHGDYWHITKDPNFTIDPNRGPRDMSSLANGQEAVGKLMVTSHLDYWGDEYGEDRAYAALIDMSEVPRDSYYQVSRGFGNEFWVEDPSKAKVIAVMPIQKAKAKKRQIDKVLEKWVWDEKSLETFYNLARGQVKQADSPVGDAAVPFYETTRKLPPREDLRTHIDEDLIDDPAKDDLAADKKKMEGVAPTTGAAPLKSQLTTRRFLGSSKVVRPQPKIIYHVSESNSEQSIRDRGLNANLSNDRWNPSDGEGFYAFLEYVDAIQYASERAQVLNESMQVWEVHPEKRVVSDDSFFVGGTPDEWLDSEGHPHHSSVFHSGSVSKSKVRLKALCDSNGNIEEVSSSKVATNKDDQYWLTMVMEQEEKAKAQFEKSPRIKAAMEENNWTLEQAWEEMGRDFANELFDPRNRIVASNKYVGILDNGGWISSSSQEYVLDSVMGNHGYLALDVGLATLSADEKEDEEMDWLAGMSAMNNGHIRVEVWGKEKPEVYFQMDGLGTRTVLANFLRKEGIGKSCMVEWNKNKAKEFNNFEEAADWLESL